MAVELVWSRSQVLVVLLGWCRGQGVRVVEGSEVDVVDVVDGLVCFIGGGGVASVRGGGGGGLVTGEADDDELFSEGRRRRLVEHLFEMATGVGEGKIQDTAKVRAAESYAKMAGEHWERRSRADDDAVVAELLERMTVADLRGLLAQAEALVVESEGEVLAT